MTTAAQLIAAEKAARIKADGDLESRIMAELDKRVPPVPVPPNPPTLPPGTVVVPPSMDAKALIAGGARSIALRGDASTPHRFAFGSVPTTFPNVSILTYPGDSAVIDGTGLDPDPLGPLNHFVYFDAASGTWTLGVKIIGFRPQDSAIVAIGDACKLIRVPGYAIVGVGPGGTWLRGKAENSHGEYFHGTGTASGPIDITNVPGSAVTSWRGSPVVTIDGGRAGSHYISLLGGAGRITANGVDFVRADGTQTGPLPKMDVQQYRGTEPEADPNATVILNLCTGTGPGASVRRVG